MVIFLLSFFSFSCSGVLVLSLESRAFAILPNSVLLPIAIHRAFVLPCVIKQPLYSIFSCLKFSINSKDFSASFALGILSPVRLDSSHNRLCAFKITQSLGILSPLSKSKISPTTISSCAMFCNSPFRKVFIKLPCAILFRDSNAF